MKIAHVSFAVIENYRDPETFLKTIEYFTGILDQQALQHSVVSVYTHSIEGEFQRKRVFYKFFSPSAGRNIAPLKMCRYVRSVTPDIIIAHGLHFPIQLLLLRRVVGSTPAIYVQHHAERPLRSLRKVLQKVNDQFIRGYFFCARELGAEWHKSRLISDEKKIHEVMEVSSTFSPVPKLPARKLLGLVGSEKIYLWVGRLDKNKDPETLVNAFIQFINEREGVKLFIAFQSNDLLDKISRLISAVTDKIILLGALNHDQLTQWYSAADFIISTSHYEGSGLAVCEAMSCGCVPILSSIPSFRMMTDLGKCGLLFEPGNSNSLQKALEISVTIDIEEIRQQSMNRFQKHLSFQAIARKIGDVIQHDSARP